MKKYEITWDEETLVMSRTNDGFTPIELIGILEITRNKRPNVRQR